MKLVIFNGSPRNKKSNSKVLIDHFLAGYHTICNEPVAIHYLANRKQSEAQKEVFRNSEGVIIIFPLYTDCMPGIVKEFFESINELEYTDVKKIGFVVQSGFPEAVHSIYIERYLQKLTKRLKCEYLGTIIKGGVEGIQMMPPFMTKKLFRNFHDLGVYFAKKDVFSTEIQAALREPYKLTPIRKGLFNAFKMIGLTNIYWNSNLKKNNAMNMKFNKPFEEKNRS